MSEKNIKSHTKKILISIIIAVSFLSIGLFLKVQDLKWKIFYYQIVPNIELVNNLTFNSNGVAYGSLTGFVAFENKEDQPKTMRQYIEITALNYFDKEGKQQFIQKDIIKMDSLSPKAMEPSILVVKDRSGTNIILEDSGGNLFFIDKETKEVKMLDSTGDQTTLITNDSQFEDFIRDFLKE